MDLAAAQSPRAYLVVKHQTNEGVRRGTAPYALEPGLSGTYIDVKRGDREMTIHLEPVQIPGGAILRYRPDAQRMQAFLRYSTTKE